jgi:hypothetical protein
MAITSIIEAIMRVALFIDAFFFCGKTAFAASLVFLEGLFLTGLGGCIGCVIFSYPW